MLPAIGRVFASLEPRDDVIGIVEFQNVKPAATAAIWQDCVPVALVGAAWFSYIRSWVKLWNGIGDASRI